MKQISTTDIYHLCLLNHHLSSFNLSDNQAKICQPILKNVTLQKICFQDYCHQWLENSTSIYQQKLNYNHEFGLLKRREKFYDQSSKLQQRNIMDSQNSMEKYKGFLGQINSTWAFRLINSRDYPNFGQNIGIVNNSRMILVLQSKVRKNY